MLEIKDITHVEEQSWDSFVEKHPNGNIFQTRHYFFLHHLHYNCVPFGYVVLEDDNILGVMVGVIYQNYFRPVNYFTKRAVVIGGPLIKDNDSQVFTFLLEQVTKLQRRKCIYMQIRNLWDTNSFRSNFEKTGFVYEEHLDIIHDLTLPKEIINSKISKNRRGNINKSINKGTNFAEIVNFQVYKSGVELIQKTYDRVNLPSPSNEFFYNSFIRLNKSGYLRAFGAFADNDLIGIRLELCYKGLIYDWYAGSDDRFKNRYPNDFLPYHILHWGNENGFEKFDFGGAGKPDKPYGVRDHKLKFGGELVNFGRYEKVNQPLIMFFSKAAFRLLQILK